MDETGVWGVDVHIKIVALLHVLGHDEVFSTRFMA